MAFLGQLQQQMAQVTAQMQALKPHVTQVVEQASKATQGIVPIINKCTQQIDSLGKILPVRVDRKQSPVDLLPAHTAFDPALENATFNFHYDETCQLTLANIGRCLQIQYPDTGSVDLTVSFLPEEKFHLQAVNIHFGTEPMNGSLHTVGGVGYGGELHFIHRNLQYPTMEAALKQPNGVLALAVFLNESHDDNLNFIPLTKILSNVLYNGSRSGMHSFKFSQMIPNSEKNKEFWFYEGSETTESFREDVKWIVFRAAIPISSGQLDKLRELRESRAEDEVEKKMNPMRAVQSLNSRIVRSSFRSVAQSELP
ncbi:hypothetical protein QR680_009665 [Steinernema hermaphroditum]|uniref:Alpha-carbonic anhydrase domain-containing protein n=1 Tax=Steinernema hermaphroditum TaxID=289476 RepID=A0AA39IMK5_9BILA|nr:hypothetical protein QR680_009665 [Steinernema hermaphroditum]